MTILLSPDKFKGSLSAREAAEAIARGCRKVYPGARLIVRPLADGGEGSLALLKEVLPLQTHRLEVPGPMRKPVTASYLLGDGNAYIESARACGLQYVPAHRRDPGRATTIGVGLLIEDAIARGATDIKLFLGGSATNDGGAGMAGALGYRFFSDRGNDFIPTGDSLGWMTRIDTAEVIPALAGVRFTAVCDVDNPLLGPAGATHSYAPQKGATPAELPALEDHMTRFITVVEQTFGRSLRDVPGAGAAGGLGAGCLAFLRAELRPGIEVLLEAVGYDTLLAGADLVITGEGKVDEQTLRGKVVSGVGRAAAATGVPVLAFCGTRTLSERKIPGVTGLYAITDDPAVTSRQAMAQAGSLLEQLVERVLRAGE